MTAPPIYEKLASNPKPPSLLGAIKKYVATIPESKVAGIDTIKWLFLLLTKNTALVHRIITANNWLITPKYFHIIVKSTCDR